jgi:signal transduction histidine kinase
VFVSADPFRVGQVVSNLVSNALKYSDAAAPVEVTVAQAGSDQAIVSVRDEGEGIPVSEQERVFERFHRVEGHMTRRTGGTGLGLYIAKRLVEAMHGRLWVVSSPGNGSTFSFSLPAAQAPHAAEDEGDEARERSDGLPVAAEGRTSR